MPVSLVDTDSLLAVDIGTVTTRAVLFDVVDGHYRFVACGQGATTATAPYKDVREGVHSAIENLETITGRKFLGVDQRLIMPYQDGNGVDLFAVSMSAGPAIKTVVVGLLNDVSLESIQRVARSTYTRVVETLSISDRRLPHEQIDSILQASPELFLVAGGTDNGAIRSVQRLLEVVNIVCRLLPEEKRPVLLYAGNQKMADLVKSAFEPFTSAVYISPNVRPTIDVEDLQPAQRMLVEVYRQVRKTQLQGVNELSEWSAGMLLPTAHAIGRMIRFLSQDSSKGVLGVDIGASHTTVAAGFGGDLVLGVYPQLGIGEPLSGLLRYTSVEDIARWLYFDLSADDIQGYLYQKSLYPASIPATVEEMALEQAIARQLLHVALRNVSKDFPANVKRMAPGLTPDFEPIIAAGSVIAQAPTVGQSLLLLLDAIQPMGITTVLVDQNSILPALGAAASRIPILPVHVLETIAFRYLATVVSPLSNARLGTPILRARLVYQDGHDARIEVKQGALDVLPLSPGQVGRLYLQPGHHVDIGLGPGRTRNDGFPVSGTVLGVVIDARGRPLRFPTDPVRRREIIKKWLWTLGG
jgi:hypothetical protein